MKEVLELLRNWKKLAQPNGKYLTVLILVKVTINILQIIEIAVGAKFLAYLTSGNYKQAYLYLLFGLIIFVLVYLIDFFAYLTHPKSIGWSYDIIQEKLFEKLTVSTSQNYRHYSKEKLLNTFHRDGWIVGDFSHTLSVSISRAFRIVLVLGSIFLINVQIGLIAVVIAIVNYEIFKTLNRKLIKQSKIVALGRDKLQEKFSKIIDSNSSIKDIDFYNETKKAYSIENKSFVKKVLNENMRNYEINNLYVIYNQVVIFLVTIFLITTLSGGKLELALYLMIIAYVTNFIELTNSFMSIFKDLQTVNISVLRINTVLNFKEYKPVKFGNNLTDDILGNISFKNVSYDEKEGDFKGKLTNVTFNIKSNDTTFIYGQKESGKRIIFYLLRRMVPLQTGLVTIDGIDIYEFDEKTYKTNLSYATHKPLFIKDSIFYYFFFPHR